MAKTSALPVDTMLLSAQSLHALNQAAELLTRVGSDEMSKMPSLDEEPVAPKEAPKRAPRQRRPDLRLWDAVLDLDVEAASQAVKDGALANMIRANQNLFERWLEGAAQAQFRLAQLPEQERAMALKSAQEKSQAMASFLSERGASMMKNEPEKGAETAETASKRGRARAARSWKRDWLGLPELAWPVLARQALAWDKDSVERLPLSQALNLGLEQENYYWFDFGFVGELCSAGATLGDAHWARVEKILDKSDARSHGPHLFKMLPGRSEPLGATLGALCAQVALNGDDAKLLTLVAQKGGLGCMVGYGNGRGVGHGEGPVPALLWALMKTHKVKGEEGQPSKGRDCFELLAKIPQMVEAAERHFLAAALSSCEGEEALSLLRRFPFMAKVDAKGDNVAHAWVDGRYLSIHSINKFKKLLNGGFAELLSQPNKKGKTPLDLLKAAGGTSALRQAVSDWGKTYAQWEKREMKVDAPRKTVASKQAASKRL